MRGWRLRPLLAALAAGFALASGAHAAGIKQVGDWLGVCDNTGACTAFGFAAGEGDLGAYLVLHRDAGPAAAPKLTIVYDAANTQPAADWRLTLDDHPIAGVGPVHAVGSDAGARAELTGHAAAAVIAAARNGKALQFAAAGKDGSEISLDGSAAILLWLDAQQGRVDTATALARPGPKSAASVPGPKAIPLIASAPAVSQAGVPKHAPTSMIKGIKDCEDTPLPKDRDDIVARLAPGLFLWGPQCDMGAYNEINVFFLGDEHGGHLKRVTFFEPPGASQAKDDTLVNASFDATSQTMATFAKARGIGDCGDVTDWVWDGRAFRVISQDTMPACRGVLPDDWPPLFVSRQK